MEDEGIQNAVIVLDLAPTHLTMADERDNLSAALKSKANALSWCRRHNVSVDENLNAESIKKIVRDNFGGETWAQLKARSCGHSVLYLPTHHPSLNPIELLWAYLKNKLNYLYYRGRSFSDVIGHAKTILKNVEKEKIKNMIMHTKKKEREFIDLEVHVHHQKDLERKREYRELMDLYEKASDPNDEKNEEKKVGTQRPQTMPLSFRGHLNRYFKN